jgi:hypothetical protein
MKGEMKEIKFIVKVTAIIMKGIISYSFFSCPHIVASLSLPGDCPS